MNYSADEENILSLFCSGYWEDLETPFPDVLLEDIFEHFKLDKFPLENIFEGTIKQKIKQHYWEKFSKGSPFIAMESMINFNSIWMQKLNTDFDPNRKKFSTFYLYPKKENLEKEITLIYKLYQKNRDSYFHKDNLSKDDTKRILAHILKLLFFTGENTIDIYDRYALHNIFLNQFSYEKNILPLFSILNEIASSYNKLVIFRFHSVFKGKKEISDTELEIKEKKQFIIDKLKDIDKRFKNLKIKSYVYFDKSGKDINNHSRYFLFSDLCFFADKGIQILTLKNYNKPEKYKIEFNFKLASEIEKNEISEFISKTKPDEILDENYR